MNSRGASQKTEKGTKEEEVEQKERKRKYKKIRETWVVGIEACINRLPLSLPPYIPTLWEIKDWNLNHLSPFSKVHNFYGRSLLWGYSRWGSIPFLDFYLLRKLILWRESTTPQVSRVGELMSYQLVGSLEPSTPWMELSNLLQQIQHSFLPCLLKVDIFGNSSI